MYDPNISARPSRQSKGASPSTFRKCQLKTHEIPKKTFYEARIKKINQVFSEHQITFELDINEETLLSVLDGIGHQLFDRTIAKQLFEKIDGPSFKVRDFVETHIKAEYLLLRQLDEIDEELTKVTREREALEEQFEKLVSDPSEQSSLQVTVIEAVNDDDNRFNIDQSTTFSVIVFCDKYKYETEEVPCDPDNFNPTFNHTFHIKVKSRTDVIQVILRDNYRFANDNSYKDYRCTIDLNNYQDIKTYDTWFDIFDGMGQPTKLKIHATVKCDFSKVSGLVEHLRNLQDEEEELAEMSQEYEENIRKLIQPFAYSGQGGDSRYTSPKKPSQFASSNGRQSEKY